MGICGVGLFQLYNNDDKDVGSAFGNSGSEHTSISISNESCNATGTYHVSVKDVGNGNAVVFKVKVEAKCCQCAKIGPTGCN